MTGPYLLIVAVVVALVIAFIITMLVLNISAKNMVSINTLLVENQNALMEQNRIQNDEFRRRINELEEQLKKHIEDEVTLLREETRQQREQIELTANMGDEELLDWINQKMDETRIYTDTNLTLKTMANALGLTQRRLGALFKNNEKYNSLGD